MCRNLHATHTTSTRSEFENSFTEWVSECVREGGGEDWTGRNRDNWKCFMGDMERVIIILNINGVPARLLCCWRCWSIWKWLLSNNNIIFLFSSIQYNIISFSFTCMLCWRNLAPVLPRTLHVHVPHSMASKSQLNGKRCFALTSTQHCRVTQSHTQPFVSNVPICPRTLSTNVDFLLNWRTLCGACIRVCLRVCERACVLRVAVAKQTTRYQICAHCMRAATFYK